MVMLFCHVGGKVILYGISSNLGKKGFCLCLQAFRVRGKE
jgi:hypothetical protein